MVRRHYVKEHTRDDGHVRVRSYIAGSDTFPFQIKGKIPDYLTQFNALEAESKRLNDEQLEEDLLRFEEERKERDTAINDYYAGEFENVREAINFHLKELEAMDHEHSLERLAFYKEALEELGKKHGAYEEKKGEEDE